MNVVTVKTKEEMSATASKLIVDKLRQKPELVLGVATGGTPIGTYEEFVDRVKQEELDVSSMRTVNLDEYVGLPRDHEESYWHYIYTHLYKPLKLPVENAFVPDGLSRDLEAECNRYEEAIESLGGVDLQLLGVGRNGHIGFNEPGTPMDSRTHVVELTESTRQANARFFNDIEEVPTQAITVGISTIMKSRSILLLASGQEKCAAVEALLDGKVDIEWPVTILNGHPDVTLIVTEDAYCSDKEDDHA
ncbi:glucosamine-6-phosphate deaminase [Pseudalkalibacillus sp. SCS-8]|uniref:glucosamine-6-phosphate deaminase n=1 Tax=Pseudalkalibacillus nanhaiensis TaxID=3115291 RepID=UPI0032DA70CB